MELAGEDELYKECMKIIKERGSCPSGEAVITLAGKLKSKYIIHTVVPIWKGENNNEEETLAKCYENTMKLAVKNKIRTIAFPNISTGIYGFPKLFAAKIALSSVCKFLDENDEMDKVIFVCYDEENWEIYRILMNEK